MAQDPTVQKKHTKKKEEQPITTGKKSQYKQLTLTFKTVPKEASREEQQEHTQDKAHTNK